METADGRPEAPLVFVACGVLETPMLLRRSLAATARSVHARLGRNLGDHQQSNSAWPLCACGGPFAHPEAGMPRHSPVSYAVGDELFTVEPTHLPWAFSVPALLYNVFLARGRRHHVLRVLDAALGGLRAAASTSRRRADRGRAHRRA